MIDSFVREGPEFDRKNLDFFLEKLDLNDVRFSLKNNLKFHKSENEKFIRNHQKLKSPKCHQKEFIISLKSKVFFWSFLKFWIKSTVSSGKVIEFHE